MAQVLPSKKKSYTKHMSDSGQLRTGHTQTDRLTA